jgi:hypothetical protein
MSTPYTSTPLTYPGVGIVETLYPLITTPPGFPGIAVPTFVASYNIGPNVPTLIGSWQQYIALFGTFAVANGNMLPYYVYQFFANRGKSCYIIRVENSDATQSTLTLNDTSATPALDVTALYPGAYTTSGSTFGGVYIQITTAGGSAGRFDFLTYSGGSGVSQLVEIFPDLSLNPADPRYVGSIINSPTTGSAYVSVKFHGAYTYTSNQLALLASPSAMTNSGPANGDGVVAPDMTTANSLGIKRLDMLQDIILDVAIPGAEANSSIINNFLSYADSRGDMMVFAAGPTPVFPETSATVAANYASTLVPALNISSRGTLWAPWVQQQDPGSSIPGATIWLPPVGGVLGITQDTDIQIGPNQSPAGVTATLRVVNLEARFTPSDLTTLTKAGVNPVKVVPGYGFCVFGARTLHPGYPDRYISIRRMLQKIEHDAIALVRFALFQPNDAVLWAAIETTLVGYLTQLMQAGQLAGTTIKDSFNVICDSTINTPLGALAGIVNVYVSVALAAPAEFITIYINLLQQGATVTTTVGVGAAAGTNQLVQVS